jgi:hypothetical protein
VAENVEWADWSGSGELAIVVGTETRRTLEHPPGKALFQTTGWISDPRFSGRGDRIALIHHPILGDDMGEIVVVDLQGGTRTLTRRLPTTVGLAWAPGDRELLFTAGTAKIDTLSAVDLEGRQRELYRSPSEIRLEDVGADGSVLLTSRFDRTDLVHVDPQGRATLLSWTDWNYYVASVSDEGKVLFSLTDPTPVAEGLQRSLAVLRKADRSPAQILGEGSAEDLSSDGRWALVRGGDGRSLSALPTGPGQPRRFEIGDLEVSGARWLPGGERALLVGRTPLAPGHRLFLTGTDGTRPRPLSDHPLAAPGVLTVSPDGRSVAALDEGRQPVVISVSDGKTVRIPGIEPGVYPRGWATETQLWLARGGERAPARFQLLRVDVPSGQVMEARAVGAGEPSGSGPVGGVAISRTGGRWHSTSAAASIPLHLRASPSRAGTFRRRSADLLPDAQRYPPQCDARGHRPASILRVFSSMDRHGCCSAGSAPAAGAERRSSHDGSFRANRERQPDAGTVRAGGLPLRDGCPVPRSGPPGWGAGTGRGHARREQDGSGLDRPGHVAPVVIGDLDSRALLTGPAPGRGCAGAAPMSPDP